MMIKGPPLEFKLLRKGEFVGYGKFAINIDHPAFGLTWHTSTDGKVWYYGNCVLYDAMRQSTGFNAENGKIYFGDNVNDGNGPWNKLKVEMSLDGEIVAANKMFCVHPKDFNLLEIVK